MKIFNLNSKKYPSSCDQPSAGIIKWPLLKSPGFHYHASSKAPKSHVKIITYMNSDNVIYLIVYVVFYMSPQLILLGPKSQDLVISFHIGEGETLPQFHLKSIQVRSEISCCKIKKGK